MFKRMEKKVPEKIIDIEAGMQGNVKFNSPVNLRINGKFEGELETKGILTIGEKADIRAKVIKGDDITILGKVKAEVISTNRLELSSSASLVGNIEATILVVKEGAILKGHCRVPAETKEAKSHKSSKEKKIKTKTEKGENP